MKKGHFAPDDFEITPERLEWAMQAFRITKEEVERQTEEWHDFEYRRAYSDWNRAWRRWFRQADKFGTLKREAKPRRPEVVSAEQRTQDVRKWEEDMQRMGVSVVDAAKKASVR